MRPRRSSPWTPSPGLAAPGPTVTRRPPEARNILPRGPHGGGPDFWPGMENITSSLYPQQARERSRADPRHSVRGSSPRGRSTVRVGSELAFATFVKARRRGFVKSRVSRAAKSCDSHLAQARAPGALARDCQCVDHLVESSEQKDSAKVWAHTHDAIGPRRGQFTQT